MHKRVSKSLVISCFIILSLCLVYNLELFQHEKISRSERALLYRWILPIFNPEDNEEELELTLVKWNEDTMYLG